MTDSEGRDSEFREITLDDDLLALLGRIALLEGDIDGQIKLAITNPDDFRQFISALGLSADEDAMQMLKLAQTICSDKGLLRDPEQISASDAGPKRDRPPGIVSHETTIVPHSPELMADLVLEETGEQLGPTPTPTRSVHYEGARHPRGPRHLFTSESVTEGHPDKIADQIADAVLDAVLADDPTGRVACEVLLTTGTCIVAGEITTTTYVDVPRIARGTIDYVGYNDATYGFVCNTCGVHNLIQSQSPDISMGVDTGGAGDQGMMFGFACDETAELMPLPIMMAHKLVRRLSEARRHGLLEFLRPDGKSQVSVEYEGNIPKRIEAVVISTQHSPNISTEDLRLEVKKHIIDPVLPYNMVDSQTRFHINPTGRFVVGGPNGDTGLTGRKIIVDTYGGMGRHGGGAFSGKDPTKVDRSASYMARYIAKNLVAAKLASRCEVQLAYAIGVAEPVSVRVDTFGTGVVSDEHFPDLVRRIFPLTPRGIIEHLKLRRPIYRRTAAFGHFGRTEDTFTWEATDQVGYLRSLVEIEVGAQMSLV